MKLRTALLAISVSASLAQTPVAGSVIKNGTGGVLFVRFSPDGRELVRICQFGYPDAAATMLLDTKGYHRARTFPVGLRMAAYSADGTRIATAEGTDGARIWDASAAGTPLSKAVRDATHLGLDQIRLLDRPLRVLQAPSKDSKQRVFVAEFSPDGQHVLTTHANGHVKIWNTESGTLEDDLTPTAAEVRAAAFSPDGETIMIGDTAGVLYHWNVKTKATIRTLDGQKSAGAIAGIAFAPDGKTMVVTHQTGKGGAAMIWNTTSWIPQIESGFWSAAFSKDGKTLALGGTQIKLVDPSSGSAIRTIELPEMTLREAAPEMPWDAMKVDRADSDRKFPVGILSLAFSPDGGTLAAGCQDTTVRLVKMGRE